METVGGEDVEVHDVVRFILDVLSFACIVYIVYAHFMVLKHNEQIIKCNRTLIEVIETQKETIEKQKDTIAIMKTKEMYDSPLWRRRDGEELWMNL